MNVYLLSRGEYSDYEVIAIYDEDHKSDCEQAAKAIGGECEGPLVLNQFSTDQPPADKQYYSFAMCKDGSIVDIKSASQPESSLTKDGKLKNQGYYTRTALNTYRERASYWRLNIGMYAYSFEHAVKVASEIRTQIIAGAKAEEGSI